MQNWRNGVWNTRGIRLDIASEDNAVYDKRVATSENADPAKRPYLDVTTTDGVPPAPELLQPSDSAMSFTLTPHLEVDDVIDPNGDPVSYYFRVTTGDDADDGQFFDSGWRGTPSWDVPSGMLRDGVTYFWKVFASDGTTTVPSVPQSFETNLFPGGPSDSIGPVSVDLVTGNMSMGAASRSFPAVGGDIGLSYAYNSTAPPVRGLKGEYFVDANGNRQFDDTAGPSDSHRSADRLRLVGGQSVRIHPSVYRRRPCRRVSRSVGRQRRRSRDGSVELRRISRRRRPDLGEQCARRG